MSIKTASQNRISNIIIAFFKMRKCYLYIFFISFNSQGSQIIHNQYISFLNLFILHDILQHIYYPTKDTYKKPSYMNILKNAIYQKQQFGSHKTRSKNRSCDLVGWGRVRRCHGNNENGTRIPGDRELNRTNNMAWAIAFSCYVFDLTISAHKCFLKPLRQYILSIDVLILNTVQDLIKLNYIFQTNFCRKRSKIFYIKKMSYGHHRIDQNHRVRKQ